MKALVGAFNKEGPSLGTVKSLRVFIDSSINTELGNDCCGHEKLLSPRVEKTQKCPREQMAAPIEALFSIEPPRLFTMLEQEIFL